MFGCRSSSFSDNSKTPCSCSPPASDRLLLFLGAIATGITSATVCMDKALLLSAGATFDCVHGTGYVGFTSHDGGRDILEETLQSGVRLREEV